MDPDAIQDLFQHLGSVRTRRMFGGQGVYSGSLMFALEMDGELYLKADDHNRPAFLAAGSQAFAYVRGGKVHTLSYWRLPSEAADDPDEAARWARLSIAAAARAARPSRRTPKR